MIKYAEAEGSVKDIDNLAHTIQALEVQSKTFGAARDKQRDAGTLDENSIDANPGLISASIRLRAKKLLTRLMNGIHLTKPWQHRHRCIQAYAYSAYLNVFKHLYTHAVMHTRHTNTHARYTTA